MAHLELRGIGKSFFGIPVLRDVDILLDSGRILGLVGENGAGKSTLVNILGGVVPRDAGSMLLGGAEYEPRSPGDAEARGVAFIHQELNLFPNLSVEENLFLTRFPRRSVLGIPSIDRSALRRRARGLLDEVNLAVPPDAPVESLSQGERQLVEIAKAIGVEASVLILDEPTTSLTSREAERLFAIMGHLRARGLALIYISHALGDVLRVCDDIAVLRDGRLVASGGRDRFDLDGLIAEMVGRRLEQLFPIRAGLPSSQPALEARSLTQPGILRDVSFVLRRGEILGVAGLMGSGRTELARILFGLDPLESGDILLGGASIRRLSPRERIARGLSYVTESRREEGLLQDASARENLALVQLPQLSPPPLRLVRGDRLVAETDETARSVRLSGDLERPAKVLSGGNQQKVVIGKWLLRRPSVFILDEPTRGVDVGAKHEVYGIVAGLADDGVGVLVISSELEELMGICDRILVLRRGEAGAILERGEFSKETILRAALPA